MKNQETYKIEKNIPIPRKQHKSKYPIYTMEVGDSFCVNTLYEKHAVANLCRRHVKRDQIGKNKVFTSRRIENLRYRIWRIK